MDRAWRCILAGGSRHGTWLLQSVAAEASFPPACELDGECYMPMTLTSTSSPTATSPDSPPMAGSCVMAHSQATLEQVQDAHQMMLAVAMVSELAGDAGAAAQGAAPVSGL
jgi:hypothetical protein